MILVVDDNEQFRRLLGRILERAGYEVALVGSGAEALASIKAGCGYELLMIDYQLGQGEDGVAVATAARSLGVTVPFILISGDIEKMREIDPERMAVADFIDRVGKPVVSTDLIPIINKATGREMRLPIPELPVATVESAGDDPA